MRRYLDDDVDHPGPHARPPQGPVRPARPASGCSTIAGADLADLLRRHQRRAQAAWRSASTRSWTPRHAAGPSPTTAGGHARTKRRLAARPLHRASQRHDAAAGRRWTWCWPPRCCRSAWTCPRFGLMVVTGQPKNTAEYIQASSRVGRDAGRPGLVVTLYNWTRPRDLAHYEDFEHYHATFYRQVEALSVTPYTRRALDRGTAGDLRRGRAQRRARPSPATPTPTTCRSTARWSQRSSTGCWPGPRRRRRPRGRGLPAGADQRLRDRVEQAQDRLGPARLRQDGTGKQQQLVGLLDRGRRRRVDDLTVGRCRCGRPRTRSTCCSPAGELFDPLYGAPQWSFGAPPATTRRPTSDDEPDGDELGESHPDREGRR